MRENIIYLELMMNTREPRTHKYSTEQLLYVLNTYIGRIDAFFVGISSVASESCAVFFFAELTKQFFYSSDPKERQPTTIHSNTKYTTKTETVYAYVVVSGNYVWICEKSILERNLYAHVLLLPIISVDFALYLYKVLQLTASIYFVFISIAALMNFDRDYINEVKISP